MVASAALQPAASPLNVPVPTPRPDDAPGDNIETINSSAPKPDNSPQGRINQLETKSAETQDKLKAINEQTGALQPPKMDLPPPPEPKNTNPLEMWGSAAMALAAVGSLLTRQPLTTAMNSAAAVMTAFKKNDTEAANTAFEQWKASTDLAIKQQNFQMEAYKAALAKASTDEKTALAEFTAYAHAFGDETAVQVANDRRIEGANKMMNDRDKLNLQMEKSLPQVIEAKNLMEAMNSPEFKKQLATAKNPIEAAQMKAKLIQEVAPDMAQSNGIITDEDMRMMAEQRLAGDTSVGQNMGYGKSAAANRQRLQHMIYQVGREQGYTGADIAAATAEFQGMKAGERTLATTAARIGLGAAEMQTLVPQVKKASDELSRGDASLTMNSLIQRAQHETQKPELRSLAVRLQGLKSAYSQVLTRGGVPTDAARSATDELFSTKDSTTVLNTVLDAMGQETAAIKQAPGIVREDLRQGIGAGGRGGRGQKPAPPQAGTVEDGHRFKGGDPADPKNWEPV